MTTFTKDSPATITTSADRGSLRLLAYLNDDGNVVTDSDLGGWCVREGGYIIDSTNERHTDDWSSTGYTSEATVATIIMLDTGVEVAAADIRALWALLGVRG